MNSKFFLVLLILSLLDFRLLLAQDLNGKILQHVKSNIEKNKLSEQKIASYKNLINDKTSFDLKSRALNPYYDKKSGEADLQVAGWDYKSLWGWGCTTEIEFCEYNSSSLNIAAAHISQIYISRDRNIDTTDIRVGASVSFGPIAPEGFMLGRVNYSVPSIDTGTYHIGCIVDINNTVLESVENNTYYLGTISVTEKLSDLIAAGLEISGGDSWTVGSDLSYVISEKNAGSEKAGEHHDLLCLFDIYNNIIPVADGVLSNTSPGQINQTGQKIKIPLIFDGQYAVGFVIDSRDEIDECDEENINQIPDYFVTVTGGKTVLVAPLNGASDIENEVRLEWLPFNNPDSHYLIQVSDDPAFNSIIQNISGIKEPRYVIKGLQNKTRYYWRVAAGPEIGNYTPWSETWSFNTVSPSVPSAPVLNYPINNSLYVPTTPELCWNEIPGIIKYHLQISNDTSFAFVLISDSLLTGTKKTVGPLSYKKKYYWRLRAENLYGYGSFSDIWCFTTGSEPVASPGNLTARLQNKNVKLMWSDNSQNETSFCILRKAGDSLSTVSFNIIGSTEKNICEYTDSTVVSGNTYTYKIYASGIDTISSFSNQAQVNVLTSIEKEVIPEKFEVYQNYPNPFNSSTTICFDLPVSNYIRLSIYDLLGREIKTLVNELKSPGKYTIRLDAGKLTSGQYFYLLQAGEQRIIRKLVLMK